MSAAVAEVPGYHEFLRAKATIASQDGFEVDAAELNPLLKPHQARIVEWAVRGGRRAIFAAFGIGKSVIQLEVLRLTLAQAGGRGLIVCPLGVQQEFAHDARVDHLARTNVERNTGQTYLLADSAMSLQAASVEVLREIERELTR